MKELSVSKEEPGEARMRQCSSNSNMFAQAPADKSLRVTNCRSGAWPDSRVELPKLATTFN